MPDYTTYMPCSRVWVDPFNIKPTDKIAIEDIAVKLSRIYRFGGASTISVAEHCLTVASGVKPELKPYALLHDAFEAFTFDAPRSIKQQTGFFFANTFLSYSEMEYRAIRRIFPMFGLLPGIPMEVQEEDDRQNKIEYENICAGISSFGVIRDSNKVVEEFIHEWHSSDTKG